MKLPPSLMLIFTFLLISGCNGKSQTMPTSLPTPVSVTNAPHPAPTNTAPIPTKTATLKQTPTRRQATCSDVTIDWRATPSAKWAFTTTTTLPIETGDKLPHEKLAAALFCQYLEIYKSPQAENRIKEYVVHAAFLDERLKHLEKEFDLEFVAGVSFSVLPVSYGEWIAANGVLSDDGWIKEKFLIIGVLKQGDVYEMKILGTGP